MVAGRPGMGCGGRVAGHGASSLPSLPSLPSLLSLSPSSR